ncbi:MAG: hypothetical protein ACTSRK_14510 [Promethearchaeota archaeon]
MSQIERNLKEGYIKSTEFVRPIVIFIENNPGVNVEEIYESILEGNLGQLFTAADFFEFEDHVGRIETRWKKNVRNAMRTISSAVRSNPPERKLIYQSNRHWYRVQQT